MSNAVKGGPPASKARYVPPLTPTSNPGEARDRSLAVKAIVVGVSMGGLEALKHLLMPLPADFPIPILIVQHLAPDTGNGLAILLNACCATLVKEADDNETPLPGKIYLAPANYHLLVEPDGRLGLSIDPPVNFARPSVDVLFETAAEAFGAHLVGVVLTGAGSDGSRGLKVIQERGGGTLVQDPTEAVADSMPRSALALLTPDAVLPLAGLTDRFLSLRPSAPLY